MICTKQEHCLVQPFITEYYGNGGAHPVGIPLPTITTKDRFAVTGITDGIELGFRMLQPKELAAATGFPSDYKFTGTKSEVVKQIGNAVPPNFAKAMYEGYILMEIFNIIGEEMKKKYPEPWYSYGAATDTNKEK